MRVSQEPSAERADSADAPSPSPRPTASRFRGFLPVVVDVETGGFNAETDALLEIAAVSLSLGGDGTLAPAHRIGVHVAPFEGANIEREALEFTGIDPWSALREPQVESEALRRVFRMVRGAMREEGCNRAVLVGHNAHFDHRFLHMAVARQGLKRNPFHPFSCFDTVTLAGVAFGQTVLAKACASAGIAFDPRQAHTAVYDAEKTAELFCAVVNRWQALGGWPPPEPDADATEND